MYKEKINVLIVIENILNIGGVQDVIMHLVRGLKEKISFDIIVTNSRKGVYDEEFLEQGEIFVIPREKDVNILGVIENEKRAYTMCLSILKKKKYNAIYCCNMFNAGVFLKAAASVNVPVRIAHAQIGGPDKIKYYSRILYAIKRVNIQKYATKKLAVTPKSGSFLFGTDQDVVVSKNPIICVAEFQHLPTSENEDGKIRLLHLGTLFPRKNAKFSIGVLAELVKINPNYRLTIAGAGSDLYEKEVRTFIRTLKLEDKIELIPKFVALKEVLASHDYMLLPSLAEGLPCVLLQAQAAGQACFVSDNVEKSVDQGLCTFLPLEKGCHYWAEQIDLYYLHHGTSRVAIDMSDWDEAAVCEKYLLMFQGKL